MWCNIGMHINTHTTRTLTYLVQIHGSTSAALTSSWYPTILQIYLANILPQERVFLSGEWQGQRPTLFYSTILHCHLKYAIMDEEVLERGNFCIDKKVITWIWYMRGSMTYVHTLQKSLGMGKYKLKNLFNKWPSHFYSDSQSLNWFSISYILMEKWLHIDYMDNCKHGTRSYMYVIVIYFVP